MSDKLIKEWITYAKPLLTNPKGLSPNEFILLLANTLESEPLIRRLTKRDWSGGKIGKTGTFKIDPSANKSPSPVTRLRNELNNKHELSRVNIYGRETLRSKFAEDHLNKTEEHIKATEHYHDHAQFRKLLLDQDLIDK